MATEEGRGNIALKTPRLVVVDFLNQNPCFSVMKILLSFKTTYLRLGFQQLNLKLLTGLK